MSCTPVDRRILTLRGQRILDFPGWIFLRFIVFVRGGGGGGATFGIILMLVEKIEEKNESFRSDKYEYISNNIPYKIISSPASSHP